MRWILDIGTRKTGSKARQDFFANRLGRVRGVRAYYPAAGRAGPSHRPLFHALVAGDPTFLAQAKKEVRSAGADAAIFSYEQLHELARPRVELLREHLEDPIAVIFLRRQDLFLNSLYNQKHKSHRVGIAEIEAFERELYVYQQDLDHRITLERWSAVLGDTRVIPALYDKDGSIVAQFFAAAGIDVDLEDFAEPTLNHALSAEALGILRHVKRLARDTDDLVRLVTEAREVLADRFVDTHRGGEQYLLSAVERRRILAHYQESNDWVRRRYFPERASLFQPIEEAAAVPVDWSAGKEEAERIAEAVRRSKRKSAL